MSGEIGKQNIECNANSTHKPVGDDVLDVPLIGMAQMKFGVIVNKCN